MHLWLALIVPPVGQVRPEVGAPLQAGARHAQPREDGVGQVLDVEDEALGSCSLLDRELQQAEALARVAVASGRPARDTLHESSSTNYSVGRGIRVPARRSR